MRDTIFSSLDNAETLLAVILGAILATGGALFAEMIQERRRRNEARRDAANTIGMILMSLSGTLHLFLRSRSIGEERWGTITELYLESALRELAWFREQRHQIMHLDDVCFERRIIVEVKGLEFAVNGIAGGRRQHERLLDALEATSDDNQERYAQLENELSENSVNRDRFAAVVGHFLDRCEAMMPRLGELAGQKFELDKAALDEMSVAASSAAEASTAKE